LLFWGKNYFFENYAVNTIWHSFFDKGGMYAFMIIFFIVLAVTIVMYAAMVKKQNERDEFLKSSGGEENPRETQAHSPIR